MNKSEISMNQIWEALQRIHEDNATLKADLNKKLNDTTHKLHETNIVLNQILDDNNASLNENVNEISANLKF